MIDDELIALFREQLKELKEWLARLDAKVAKVERQILQHLIEYEHGEENKRVWSDRIWSILIRIIATLVTTGIGVYIGIKLG